MRIILLFLGSVFAIPVFYAIIVQTIFRQKYGSHYFLNSNLLELESYYYRFLHPKFYWRKILQMKKKLCKENTMKTVTIYTDGACSGNPGPGGWGAILMYGAHKKELSGGEAQTTNNRMELTGVITALSALTEPCIVELYSDSKYVIDALEKGWAKGWKARGWVKADKKPALNPDLWDQLLTLCEKHTVNLHWVKGHATNPYNNRCDELAVAESRKFR